MKDTLPFRPPRRIRAAMGCILTILSVPAFGEKGTLEGEWGARLAKARDRFSTFEVITEVWRYEVFDATAAVDAAWTEDWVRGLERRLSSTEAGAVDLREGLSFLLEEGRRVFGSPAETAEMSVEVHQRDAEAGSYATWERRSGTLSIFARQGTWHQSEGLISMGPPAAPSSLELAPTRLGLFLPSQAKVLEVPSATPESPAEAMVFQWDRGETRLRMGARPWRGEGGLSFLEEAQRVEGEAGKVFEKRFFLRFQPASAKGECAMPPEAALEFRYTPRGTVESYAVVRIHPPVTSIEEWEPFPSARPPFGWRVLDYRFLPEREFVFGEAP